MSLVDAKDNSWRYRKISILGAAKGIVSQLNHGQDLTHISMPAVFLYPYSILELGGLRLLNRINYLYEVNNLKDPLDRMKWICQWFISIFEQEWQERKPYNPILGETHRCWTDHEKYGRTNIILEQIEHHPAVTAFGVEHKEQQIKFEGDLEFIAEFGGNSLHLTSRGYSRVILGKFQDEQYIFSRHFPDMLVTNVIIGTRKHFWKNGLTLYCPETNYGANFTFYEEREGYFGEFWNYVKGSISKSQPASGHEDILFKFHGKLGDGIYLQSGTKSKSKSKKKDELWFNVKDIPMTKISYPPPEEWDEMESLRIWEEVNKAIVVDDMDSADVAKLKVEEYQRKKRAERKATGLSYKPVYFVFSNEVGPLADDAPRSLSSSNSSSNNSTTPTAELSSISAGGGWILAPSPKFEISCGQLSLRFNQPLISIPDTASIQEAAQILHNHNILCAPVMSGDLPIGLVDVLDLLSYIVGISGFFQDPSKSIESIAKNKLQYSKEPVTKIIAASGMNPIWKLERNNPLDRVLEAFSSGVHRVVVGDPKNFQILTQSQVLQYFWEQILNPSAKQHENRNFSEHEKLSKTLKELSLGSVSLREDRPISIYDNMAAIEGFRRLYVSKIHGLAILSEKDESIIANLSASHLCALNADSLDDLLLPVLQFKQKINKGDEGAITCRETDTLRYAIELLVTKNIHRVYIVDENNRPTGVVSVGDVLAQFI